MFIFFILVSFYYIHVLGGILDATGENFVDTFRYFKADLWIRNEGSLDCTNEECVFDDRRNLDYKRAVRKEKGLSRDIVPDYIEHELQLSLTNTCQGPKCCGINKESVEYCTNFTSGAIRSKNSYSFGQFHFMLRSSHNYGGCPHVRRNRNLEGYNIDQSEEDGHVPGRVEMISECRAACLATPNCKGYVWMTSEYTNGHNCALKRKWSDSSLIKTKHYHSQQITESCREMGPKSKYRAISWVSLKGSLRSFHEPILLEISFGFPSHHETSVILLAKYGEQIYQETVDLMSDRSQHGGVYAIDWSPNAITWTLNGMEIASITEKQFLIPDDPLRIHAIIIPDVKEDLIPREQYYRSVLHMYFLRYKKHDIKIEHVELLTKSDVHSLYHNGIILGLLGGVSLFVLIWLRRYMFDDIPRGYNVLNGDSGKL